MPSNFLEKIEELQKYVEIFQDGFEICADTKINTSSTGMFFCSQKLSGRSLICGKNG